MGKAVSLTVNKTHDKTRTNNELIQLVKYCLWSQKPDGVFKQSAKLILESRQVNWTITQPIFSTNVQLLSRPLKTNQLASSTVYIYQELNSSCHDVSFCSVLSQPFGLEGYSLIHFSRNDSKKS